MGASVGGFVPGEHGEAHAAASCGLIAAGDLLAGLGGARVLHAPFGEVVARVRCAERPLVVTFLRRKRAVGGGGGGAAGTGARASTSSVDSQASCAAPAAPAASGPRPSSNAAAVKMALAGAFAAAGAAVDVAGACCSACGHCACPPLAGCSGSGGYATPCAACGVSYVPRFAVTALGVAAGDARVCEMLSLAALRHEADSMPRRPLADVRRAHPVVFWNALLAVATAPAAWRPYDLGWIGAEDPTAALCAAAARAPDAAVDSPSVGVARRAFSDDGSSAGSRQGAPTADEDIAATPPAVPPRVSAASFARHSVAEGLALLSTGLPESDVPLEDASTAEALRAREGCGRASADGASLGSEADGLSLGSEATAGPAEDACDMPCVDEVAAALAEAAVGPSVDEYGRHHAHKRSAEAAELPPPPRKVPAADATTATSPGGVGSHGRRAAVVARAGALARDVACMRASLSALRAEARALCEGAWDTGGAAATGDVAALRSHIAAAPLAAAVPAALAALGRAAVAAEEARRSVECELQGIKGTVRVLVRARPPDALDADGTRLRAPGPSDSTLSLHGAGRLSIAVAGRGASFEFDRTFGFLSQQVRRRGAARRGAAR